MARKRKKRAAPRARRRGESVKAVELEQPVEPPPPAAAWSEVVDSFREMFCPGRVRPGDNFARQIIVAVSSAVLCRCSLGREKRGTSPRDLPEAYLARYNLAAIAEGGAEPYIPFKTDSVGMESPSPHWRKMWCLFQLKADEFLRSYHRRSNVESAIGSIKARCSGLVRSRLAAAQCNEVLAKVLLHNLACLVHAIEKYGIGVAFPLGTVKS